MLRSFVTSCQLLKVDPFVWFRDVRSRIANHSITKLDELLPHRWFLPYPFFLIRTFGWFDSQKQFVPLIMVP